MSKRMPVWAMILTDTLLICAAVGTFMLFDYVLPQASANSGTVVAQVDSENQTKFKLPTDSSDGSAQESSEADKVDSTEAAPSDTDSSSKAAKPPKKEYHEHTEENWYDKEGTNEYEADKALVSSVLSADVQSEQVISYAGDDAVINVSKKWFGDGSDKITYFSADIYVTSVDVLKTALANDKYGKNIKGSIFDMAKSHDAVFAVNGDFYGNSEAGFVVRNGIKYRDVLNDVDICVLYMDGRMETYAYGYYDTDELLEGGVWQAWCFGPMLLDGKGNVLDSFNTTPYLNSANPRTAMGMIEPGHYKIVTVDGRNEGYSKGATMSELAAIMSDEGCLTAYNLDGGCSSMMVYEGEYVNIPDRGRDISDIIYIGG